MKSFLRFAAKGPFVLLSVLASHAVAGPSAEIKRLIDTFEGCWSVRETHEPSAWSPRAATGVGTAEFIRGPGSTSLLQTYRSSIGEFAFEGHGVTWWNSKAQQYEGIWCENTAPDGCDDSGAVLWKDNRLIAEYEDDMDGEPTKERRTISKITSDSFTVVIEVAIGDAPLRPAITIEYQREGMCAQAQELSADRELVASVRVKYADLDLTSAADISIMLDRLEQAAFRACGGHPRWHLSYEVMPSYTAAAFKECRKDAIAAAVRAINAPALSRALAEAVAKARRK
jgi:UrcA family protein